MDVLLSDAFLARDGRSYLFKITGDESYTYYKYIGNIVGAITGLGMWSAGFFCSTSKDDCY